MGGILIFFIIMSVILYITRVLALRLYEKNNPEIVETMESLALEKLENFEEDDDELIAVISAAAFQILNKKVRVKKIQFLNTNDNSAWSRTGRLNIMSSHSVKH